MKGVSSASDMTWTLRSVTGAVTLLLTALTLALAWFIYRLERATTRRREIASARSVLLAVKRGIVEGMPELGEYLRGWGEVYFSTIYDGRTAALRANETRKAVEARGWDQVFVVPTEPLELLATSAAADLISEETVFAANFALWRVGVFNQLVQKQTQFNARHAAEMVDPATTEGRLRALGVAASNITESIHFDGIGTASAEGGWYARLTAAVTRDVDRLTQLLEGRSRWGYRGERHLAIGDVVALLLSIGASTFVLVQGLT
jgi:hypothetical protein